MCKKNQEKKKKNNMSGSAKRNRKYPIIFFIRTGSNSHKITTDFIQWQRQECKEVKNLLKTVHVLKNALFMFIIFPYGFGNFYIKLFFKNV